MSIQYSMIWSWELIAIPKGIQLGFSLKLLQPLHKKSNLISSITVKNHYSLKKAWNPTSLKNRSENGYKVDPMLFIKENLFVTKKPKQLSVNLFPSSTSLKIMNKYTLHTASHTPIHIYSIDWSSLKLNIKIWSMYPMKMNQQEAYLSLF